jgi:hypothetical protein
MIWLRWQGWTGLATCMIAEGKPSLPLSLLKPPTISSHSAASVIRIVFFGQESPCLYGCQLSCNIGLLCGHHGKCAFGGDKCVTWVYSFSKIPRTDVLGPSSAIKFYTRSPILYTIRCSRLSLCLLDSHPSIRKSSLWDGALSWLPGFPLSPIGVSVWAASCDALAS